MPKHLPYSRAQRMSPAVQHEISAMIARRELPALRHASCLENNLVSVLDVQAAPKCNFFRVFISVLQNEHREEVLQLLQESKLAIEQALFKRLRMRSKPQLDFRLDDSLERGSQVLSLIDKLEDDGNSQAEMPSMIP